MHTFTVLFLAALALTTTLKMWLGLRHIRHVAAAREAVPAEFAAEITAEAHRTAADYSNAKTRLSLLSIVFEAAVVLVLTFGGVLQVLDGLSSAWFEPGVARGVTLIIMLGALMAVIEMPFDIYRTFVIEQRFGFNKMTPRMFILDGIKHALLGAALGVPLVAAILWVMAGMGPAWWLYAWLVWMAFNLMVLAIFPTWIAPLFNKFAPLEDLALKSRIEGLLERCGFKVGGLMVMDGSKRSSHGNAYFTGFGKTKRIVFFDTLLERLSPQEVEAVLAHELGHFKHRHVIKRMVWTFAVSLAFLWLLAQLMTQTWFYTALGVSTSSTAMALLLFFIVVPQFTFLLSPLSSYYSRKHEFEADHYATEQAAADDLVTALVKLYKDNAATLTPDPLHSLFYDSHPPATARIARLKAVG